MFTNYYFFIALFILLIPAIVLGIKEKSLRLYRDILSIIFIWYVFRSDITKFVYFTGYIILALYTVKIFSFFQKKNGRSSFVCGTCVAIVLLPLFVFKFGSYINITGYSFLGISYLCFRVIQVIFEVYDGLIEEVNTIQFLEFLVFWPALSSGPIDRSRRFDEDNNYVRCRNEYLDILSVGLIKIITGIFYKFVCSNFFYNVLIHLEGEIIIHTIKYAYVYGIYLFFDFAGYSLMAIGTAYILGIRLPDNFDKPFLAVNIKDFWNRWHISLSHWFRDYVFTRLMKNVLKKKMFKKRINAAAVVYIANMLIMGIWHGNGKQYVIYGLYHGVLLAINEYYEKTSFYKNNKNKVVYKVVSWAITINLVMFGFLIFSGYLNDYIC